MSLKSVQKIFFILISFGILLLGFLNSYNRYVDNVSLSHQEMVKMINIIKGNVDIESLKHLKGDLSDTNNIHYLKLRHQLTSLNNAFMDVRYIYILGVEDSNFFFYIDTQPNNRSKESISELATPGEIYLDAPEDFFHSYESKKEMVCGPYEDKWGRFLSIVSPIPDYNSSEIIAMIGADILYDESVTFFQLSNFIPLIFSIITVLIILILYFFVGKKHIEDRKQIIEYTKLKAAINQINYPVIIINRNLRVDFFNPAANFLLQTSLFKELAMNNYIGQLFAEHHLRLIENAINKKIQNDDIGDERIIIPKFIENKQLQIDISPIIDVDEEISQFVLIFELSENSTIISNQSAINQESNSKMEMILEYIKEVVWELDFEGLIISCSSSVHHLLGYRSDDLVYKDFYSILSQKSAEKFKKSTENAYSAVRNNTKVEDVLMVLEMRHKTNKYVDVEIHMSVPKSNSQEPIGIIIVGRKVNENIDAIVELYETKKTVQTYFNHIPGMLYRCAIDRNWTMKFISNGCNDLTGYSVDDLIENKKTAFNDLILPEFREILWGKWYKSIENNIPFEGEYQIQTASGEIKWVFENGRCVYNENGSPIALEGFIIDVSEKKKSEKLLQENEKRFRNYLENSNIAIFVTNHEGNITDFNHSLSDLTKMESSVLLKTKVQSLIDPAYLDSFIRKFNQLQSIGQINLVVNIKTEDCEKMTMLFASLINQFELVFYLVDIEDIMKDKQQLSVNFLLLKKSIENLPFTCYLINGETKEILVSSHYADIFKPNECPCAILNNNSNQKCEVSPDFCIVQNYINNPINEETFFEVEVEQKIKTYRAQISVIDMENLNDENYYLVTLVDVSNKIEMESKILAVAGSLDKMLSFYFKNSQKIYKQLHQALQSEVENTSLLSSELNHSAQMAEYTSMLLINQNQDEVVVINSNEFWKTFLINYQKSIINIGLKNFFFEDYLNGDVDIEFSRKAFQTIVDLLIKYSKSHSKNNMPVISHTYNPVDNSYHIKSLFEVSENCYNEIIVSEESDYFELFSRYPNSDSSSIDYAFLKKVCNMNNCILTIEKLTNNRIECTVKIDSVLRYNPQNPDLKNSKICFLTSHEEALNYYSFLFGFANSKYYFNDYLSAIKRFNMMDAIDFPEYFVMHYQVNNIEIADFLDRFDFDRFQTNPKLIIILPKAALNKVKHFCDTKYQNISYLCYPFTKEDLYKECEN